MHIYYSRTVLIGAHLSGTVTWLRTNWCTKPSFLANNYSYFWVFYSFFALYCSSTLHVTDMGEFATQERRKLSRSGQIWQKGEKMLSLKLRGERGARFTRSPASRRKPRGARAYVLSCHPMGSSRDGSRSRLALSLCRSVSSRRQPTGSSSSLRGIRRSSSLCWGMVSISSSIPYSIS